MSDLTATNCGCSNDCSCSRNNNIFGCDSCSIIWIILLLSCFCGSGNGSCGTGLFSGNDGNGGCCWIIWILLLSSFCGNNSCGC